MIVKAVKVNNVPLFTFSVKKNVGHLASKVLGGSFISNKNTWYFPAYYPFGLQVYHELKMVFQEVQWDSSAVTRIKHLEKSKKLIENKSLISMDFKTHPMEHQHEALLYAILYMRLGIFWDCGVGKTKLAIDTIRYLKQNVLFVCPSRLVENTVDEVNTHAFENEINVFPVIGKKKRDQKIETIHEAVTTKSKAPKMLIAGYESIQYTDNTGVGTYRDLIEQFDYDFIIFDESQKLRSHRSVTANACSKLASKASRRILMTGTPSLGNPLHLFVQMRILMPWRYPNYYAFRSKFVNSDKHNPKIIRGFKNLHIIRDQVDSFSIRKTKEECIDLPERTVIPIKIPMTDEQARIYKSISLGEHESVEYNPMAILKMSKMHQMCGGTLVESPIDYEICNSCDRMPLCVEKKISVFSKRCINKDIERPVNTIILENNPKLDYLMELIHTIVLGEGKKVIVWYRYSNEKEIIRTAIEKEKEKIRLLDYSVRGHAAVSAFQKETEPSVFLAQIQSGSGITLTEATYTIYYSLTFDLEHYLQSRDRMYRKGQTKKTIEYHLLMVAPTGMASSMDEAISFSLDKKVDINNAMFNQDFRKEFISKISLK